MAGSSAGSAALCRSRFSGKVAKVVADLKDEWTFEEPVPNSVPEVGARMCLAVMGKVLERGYEAVSLVDVDGVKKLLHFPPAPPLLLQSRRWAAIFPQP
jgi:hypothetical protein